MDNAESGHRRIVGLSTSPSRAYNTILFFINDEG
jgi:hypothetical protein